jgi:hypothetical protein
MADKWDIYDYVEHRGKNLIEEWMQDLQKPDQARLMAKLDLLHANGPDLPSDLLSDTKSKHIKKIRINGRVALRPLLCRGPVNMQGREYTILCGAEERDRKFVPPNAIALAEERKQLVINEPLKRRVKRER